jgi:hypothetical protein
VLPAAGAPVHLEFLETVVFISSAESEKWRYADGNQALVRVIVLSNSATLQYPYPLTRLQP